MAMPQDRKCWALAHESKLAVSFSLADSPALYSWMLAVRLTNSYAKTIKNVTGDCCHAGPVLQPANFACLS